MPSLIVVCLILIALIAWDVKLSVDRRKLAALADSPIKFCPRCRNIVERREVADRLRIACARCSFVHWDNPKPVVIAIVPSSGKGIVLVRRKNNPAAGSWALPGGFIEANESPERAAAREVKEEVGLTVEVDRLVGVFTTTNGTNEILLIYLMKPVSTAPVAGDDASEAGIFTLDKLPEPIVFKLHKQAIDRYFAGTL
jgi:ADP-ribose pyrophosphatase YjhB (NUDIX family)